MSGNGKTYRAALEKVDRSQRYLLEDSLRLAKEAPISSAVTISSRRSAKGGWILIRRWRHRT